MQSGLEKIKAKRTDYSLLHTFGAAPGGLPADFSIYDGREIPSQNDIDMRFNPFLPALPMGCTGESGAFETGLQEGKLYNPKDLYENTPPGGSGGRDIRTMLKVLVERGVADSTGRMSPKRTAYFNCYGAGKIDDFDAARTAVWINQAERRGVYIGSWFYGEFENPVEGSGGGTSHVGADGIAPVPSFNTTEAGLHCYLATGWRTLNGQIYLECLTWQGPRVGFKGIVYLSRDIYNALMKQPYTGAFTITKTVGVTPIPIGWQAVVDHCVYFIRNLCNISPMKPPVPPQTPQPPTPPVLAPKPESPADRLAEAAVALLGKDASPKNLAPQELSCAEGVSNIIHSVYPDFPGEILGTADLYFRLKTSKHFKPVLDPVRGCIVVSPTTGSNHGHTGIYTQDNRIASNDSRTGLFEENYTRESWRAYFVTKKGLRGALFMPV